MDCTAEQALCSDFGVNGYPTLKVFRNGVPTDYSGPRKADGIISYMIKWVASSLSAGQLNLMVSRQSLPAVTDVTPESHAEFIKTDKVYVGDVAVGTANAF